MIRLTGISRTFEVGGRPVHALAGVDLLIETQEIKAGSMNLHGVRGAAVSLERMHHQLMRADQNATGRMWLHQHIKRGQLVIQTRAQNADSQHQRRIDRPQGLVEIGRLLFFNKMQYTLREGRTGRIRH